jgi:signal transduction histidine kinase/ActR/RegA family two-component response regulator
VSAGPRSADERFLICAPTGRDAALTQSLLRAHGIQATTCTDMNELCARALSEGGAGVLCAEEVLTSAALARLRELIAAQESWSDLPILLFTTRTSAFSPERLLSLGNVALLERPLQPLTMVSAVASALRARKRQYAARDELLAQQRAVRQRDQFLAMLGHELRNPLAAISMAIQELGPTREPAHREILKRQTHHLTRLVDDLLDVSRVTSGKIVLQCSAVDMRELLQRCVETVRGLGAAQQVSLSLPEQEGPCLVYGDAVRLEQVVTNLLTNAIKYTPSSGHVAARMTRTDDHVELVVADDGVGIASDMLPRVFDLFTQAEGTLDRAKGGMGIGLTLVRDLVELHGGEVSAGSDGVGRGSKFIVRLPAYASQTATARADFTKTNGAARKRSVLVVEDNNDSRELLCMALRRRGHDVSDASDGKEGVARALAERPEVMLVDIGLPELDGYGVAGKVREALGPDVMLVALTGYGQPSDRSRALAAGFDIHLTKPVNLEQLAELLNSDSSASRDP